jgi:hypothetical protein
MSGTISSENMVSFQFSQSIQPSSPMQASPSLNMIVRTLVAAVVTCDTSNVTFRNQVAVGRLS